MCGIAGLFSRDGLDIAGRDAAAAAAMLAALAHRGPDGSGKWSDPAGAALVHARLAVIDLSDAASQPMVSEDGRFVISFNGEIYNFAQLRRDLETGGERFRTASDTEVVLRILAKEGRAGLARLRGMFALAFWDSRERRGLLARDGFGIKPLYYAARSGKLAFASELRTLLGSGLVARDLDPVALAGFFATGSVPEPRSLVSGVRILPPGHTLEWQKGEMRLDAFWSVKFPTPVEQDEDTAVAALRTSLESSVSAHFVSDVPVGLFLSGGVDSTALLALAKATGHGEGFSTFSVGVDSAGHDESGVAARTARHFGVEHHTYNLDAVTAQSSLERYFDAMDVPSVDGFNTWIVSGMARSHGSKVVLSGLGGDEIFGGYPSFRKVPQARAIAASVASIPWLGRRIGDLASRHGRSSRLRRFGEIVHPGVTLAEAYRAFRGVFNLGDASLLAGHFSGQAGESLREPAFPEADALPASELDAVSYLELTSYLRNQLLRDSDVMSMAHGLELRLPFVDQALFGAVSTIPARWRIQPGKRLLKQAVPEIPAFVAQAPKRGFSFPFDRWLAQGLAEDSREIERRLPVRPREWYQHWAVLTFSKWAARHGLDCRLT